LKTKKKFKAFKKRYPDYKGKQDSVEVQEFIKDRFLEEAKSKGQDPEGFFVNFTCAIDTEKMNFVWKSINEWILKKRLDRGGFEM